MLTVVLLYIMFVLVTVAVTNLSTQWGDGYLHKVGQN